MSERYIRDHIQDMQPYEPILPLEILSEQLGLPISDIVKLDANENPYGMPPKASERLANLQYGHIYPDPDSQRLRKKVSEWLAIPPKNLVVGSGADELIDLTVRLTMDPGQSLINCPPTFGFYETVAAVNNVDIINVPRKPDFSLDLEGIRNAVKSGGKLIFLANPNNPDGGLLPPETVAGLLDLPVLVILDEAYIDFSPPGNSWITSVPAYENLIVLRTFSKWGGLAGMRLGYGAFPARLASELMKIKPPYNVSVAATEAGLGALEDGELLNHRRDLIVKEREHLYAALKTITWLEPYPTCANFILCKVLNTEAARLKAALARRGVLIRYFRKPGLEDHVRISVGKPEDTDHLLKALKECAP